MKPILFLDCDGVINTRIGSLDEDKLDLLAQIERETGCEIVLSSTWRKTEHQFWRIKLALIDRAITIDGCTPVLEHRTGSLITAQPRWEEISEWMRENRGEPSELKFVILDDEPEMGPLAAHHVHCESHIGVTPKLAQEVIRRLQ